jgi:hypothetical protein
LYHCNVSIRTLGANRTFLFRFVGPRAASSARAFEALSPAERRVQFGIKVVTWRVFHAATPGPAAQPLYDRPGMFLLYGFLASSALTTGFIFTVRCCVRRNGADDGDGEVQAHQVHIL